MIDITIQKAAVNIEALDANLRAALGALVSGFSIGREGVTVHLFDTATPTDIDQARAVVLNHDPGVLTPAQQADLLLRQKLAQSRQVYGASELDLAAYNGADPLLVVLAGKISWLEREIALQRATASTNSTSPGQTTPSVIS